MSRCASCGTEIVWVRTDKGKRMPVDAEPSPDGNIFPVDDDGMRNGVTVVVLGQPSLDDPDELWISHFATCDQADEWRRK